MVEVGAFGSLFSLVMEQCCGCGVLLLPQELLAV